MSPERAEAIIDAAVPPLTPAVTAGGVAKVAAATDTTVGTLAVVQALPALASLPVTGIRVRHVDVVVAAARLAAAAGLGGVTIVTWGTLLAASTCSSRRKTKVRSQRLEHTEKPRKLASFHQFY